MGDHEAHVSVDRLFEEAIALERAAKKHYRYFSDLFAHYAEIADFWKMMAEEEEGHALKLESVRNSLPQYILSDVADQTLVRDFQQCVRLMDRLTAERIQTLDDAYEAANELEFSEVNSVYHYIVTHFLTDEDRVVITRREIMEHQQRLVYFENTFGDKIFRRGIYVKENT